MDNTELLFASMVGTRNFKISQRVEIVQNEIQKHVLPPLPLPMFQNQSGIIETRETALETNSVKTSTSEDLQFFPLKISTRPNDDFWLLPFEPLITVAGKNNVTRRNVQKIKLRDIEFEGTVKERFAPDDYDVTVTGILVGQMERGTVEECFPRADFVKLLSYLKHKGAIYVRCPLFEMLGITQISILDYTFPFTKGENMQAFEFRAVSDSNFDLTIQ